MIATGWQTVHPALALDRTSARVYVVNDHEPDFHAASSERVLAEDTYRARPALRCASPWLRDLLVSATARRPTPSSSASTTTPTRCGRSHGAATRSSTTRATRRPGAPSRTG